MNRVRFTIASLIAPIAALCVPILIAAPFLLSEQSGKVTQLANGTPDDAPARVAGIFLLVLLPCLFLLGTAFYAAIGFALAWLKKLTIRRFIGVSTIGAFLLFACSSSLWVSSERPTAQGLLLGVVVGFVVSFFAAIGALAWWQVSTGRQPPNPSIEWTSPGTPGDASHLKR